MLSFSTAKLITCQVVVTGLTFCTSSIQRDVIHAHGQIGSNQKSTWVGSCSVMHTPHMSNLASPPWQH